MKNLLTVLLSAAVLLGCAKTKPAQASVPAKQPAVAPKVTPAPAVTKRATKKYSIVADAVALKKGAKAVATLRVKPGKGLKFNKEFPSKFIVNAGKHASCDVAKLSKRSGHVKIDGKTGVVSIPLTGTTAGSEKLSIQGSFSVCSDEQCYVLRGEMLTLAVRVN